jgi:hypothetical protein
MITITTKPDPSTWTELELAIRLNVLEIARRTHKRSEQRAAIDAENALLMAEWKKRSDAAAKHHRALLDITISMPSVVREAMLPRMRSVEYQIAGKVARPAELVVDGKPLCDAERPALGMYPGQIVLATQPDGKVLEVKRPAKTPDPISEVATIEVPGPPASWMAIDRDLFMLFNASGYMVLVGFDPELGYLCLETGGVDVDASLDPAISPPYVEWLSGWSLPERWFRLDPRALFLAWCEGIKLLGLRAMQNGVDDRQKRRCIQLALFGEERYE